MIDNDVAEAPVAASARFRVLWICVLLVGVTVAVFAAAAGYGFAPLDDEVYIAGNKSLEAGLSGRGLWWALTANLTQINLEAEYWQPLTLLTRLADWQMHGFAAGGHHVTSIALHIVAGLALFGALRTGTGSVWRSAVVAALFLIHPMHVEPVVWLAARKDVVSGLFYILTIWAYLVAVRRPGAWRQAVFFVSFTAANMAKPMAVSLPMILVMLDVWPLSRVRLGAPGWLGELGRAVWKKSHLFAIAVGVSALAFWVQKSIGAMADGGWLPLPWRIGAAGVATVNYLGKLLLPLDLAILYPHPGKNLPVVWAAVCVALVVGLTLAAWGQRVRRPWLTVGWFWMLAVLGPVCGLVQIGDQLMADRYTYLAFIGPFIAVVWQMAEWVEQRGISRRLTVGVAAAALGGFAVLAFSQVQVWRSSETVLRHALAATDENHIAHYNLAAVLKADPARHEEAVFHLLEAGKIRRQFLEYQRERATRALAENDLKRAAASLEQLVMFYPWDAELRVQLAVTQLGSGQRGRALMQLREALLLAPDHAKARQLFDQAHAVK